MVKISDLEADTVTRGSLYKFAMLNSPKNTHLGKLNISPTWRIHFYSNLWGWKEYLLVYHSEKFQTLRIRNIRDTVESISIIFEKKLEN